MTVYFQVGRDKFSKTYKFSDINYAVASREDKEAMFLEYSSYSTALTAVQPPRSPLTTAV
jgi:hypothetical protein